MREALEVVPAANEYIPEVGGSVIGCYWCVEHAPWVYQQALGRARSDPVRAALITTALHRLRWMNEAGRAFASVRQEAAMALREQERYLQRQAEASCNEAVRSTELKVAGEANAAFERHVAEARHEVATVEMRSHGQTEMVTREAERAYDIVRQEARGAISETSSEEHLLAFLLRLQES
jgi:hypothetical protein